MSRKCLKDMKIRFILVPLMSVLCLCAGVLPALRPDAGDTAGSSGSGDERLTGTGRVDGYAGVTEDDDGTEAAAAGSGEAANGAETAAACTGTALAGTGAAVAGAVGLLYKCDMADINPWKVQTCDVDGDGRTEISIGVYKTARFHPVMAKRPFIYEWHGNAISPKWLGSRLSRPFDDYIFADINADGVDEIISIEHLRDGRKAVNSYSWKGFGFEGIGESTAFDDIYSIGKITPDDGGEELIEVLVLMERQKRRVILRYGEERLEYSFADTGGAD